MPPCATMLLPGAGLALEEQGSSPDSLRYYDQVAADAPDKELRAWAKARGGPRWRPSSSRWPQPAPKPASRPERDQGRQAMSPARASTLALVAAPRPRREPCCGDRLPSGPAAPGAVAGAPAGAPGDGAAHHRGPRSSARSGPRVAAGVAAPGQAGGAAAPHRAAAIAPALPTAAAACGGERSSRCAPPRRCRLRAGWRAIPWAACSAWPRAARVPGAPGYQRAGLRARAGGIPRR